MNLSKESLLKALSTVNDPDLHKDLVSLNMISEPEISGNKVAFKIILTTPACPLKDKMRKECIDAIHLIAPEAEIEIGFDAKVTTQRKSEALPGIKNIIGVVSGKGGVGKSTIAVNLAVGLAKSGAKVGLVDADIYGPSIPQMFDLVNAQPEMIEQDGKNLIVPFEKYGVKLISIGFFVDQSKALIWRGPMISSALTQILNETHWGELDYLVFDMPPGTGDIHLTLVQNYSVTGIVVVSTPQEVALADARKALNMFTEETIKVPVLGIVENMSYFSPTELPNNKYYIFGKGGARSLAEEMGIKLLGEIPILEAVCQSGEKGVPAVTDTKTPVGEAFYTMAQNVAQAIAIRNSKSGPTKIVEINH